MSYYIIGEPEFEASGWYKSIFNGIISEKKQRRFSLTALDCAADVAELSISDDDVAFIIGGDVSWISSTAEEVSALFGNRVIVLGNCEHSEIHPYSVVTTDIRESVNLLYKHLSTSVGDRIALFGINPYSASDLYKKDAFLSLGNTESSLFYNNGSISECVDGFLSRMDEFDGVICVNSYAAVYLSRAVCDADVCVCSVGSSALADRSDFDIPYTESDYGAFAREGIELSRLLIRNPDISSITLKLSSSFYCGGAVSDNAELKNIISHPQQRGDVRFYSDNDMLLMIRLDNMLSALSDEDERILHMLTVGETYQTIAESCYMSEGGIKYKVKNMIEVAGVNNRAELVELLRKYKK